jgi:predicted enzyme related to lactoylglutathione lyase
MSTDVQTHVGRVVWHELLTMDVEKAKAFYTELLGWSIEVWKPGEMDYPMVSVDGQSHGGIMKLDPATGAPPHWLGHVQVESVDDTIARATQRGGKVVFGPIDIPEVGRFAAIADPQGAVFSVYTPAGEGPTSEGVFVWDELIVPDVEAAKAFYTEVIGWTTADMDMGEAGVYTLLNRAGDVNSAGILKRPEGMDWPAHWLVYLATDDVDATAQRAVELGGQVHAPAFDVPGVGRLAILGDPTGAAFGIFKANAA